ncbi:MAG: DUF3035 domain-containing protein [Alphaproteobacteria bacterium]|nr:DUF3035 domain-containing protein [Alphaproteobacteria bacterium]
MTQRLHFITITLLSGCFLLYGCQNVKKSLGIDRDPPDEFSVSPSIQPLDMPPDFFALPTPQPGTPRPQDVKEFDAKKEKFLGSKPNNKTASPGQKALLDLAGAQEGQDKVRQEVDAESHIEHAKGKPVLEQLGIRKTKPKGDVLNPYEESLNLENQGITTSKTKNSE